LIPYDVWVLAPSKGSNPFFSVDYLTSSWGELADALIEHIAITAAAVALATAISIPLAILAVRTRWLATPTLIVGALLYTIPSLALITGLWPVFGLSATTVIVALALYALLVILRNTIVGLQGIPEDVRIAGLGMGYSQGALLVRVGMPLALPAIMAGIRLATVSTVGLVMVGALVGHGGLGLIVLNGFTNNFYLAPIVAGTVLAVILGLLFEWVLVRVERRLSPWASR
jgi:osmoprotectant transport system permease protein